MSDSIEDITAQLAVKRAELQTKLDILNPIQTMIEQLTKEKEELKKRIEEITTSVHQAETSVKENKYDIRRLQRDIEQLERLLTQALDAATARERIQKEKSEFDEWAEEFPWHPKSHYKHCTCKYEPMPHQLEGGFILSVPRRAILADKRGLGKTLTSIIYMDRVGAKKTLVVTQPDLVPGYESELRHWAPHRTVINMRKMPALQRGVTFQMVKNLDEYTILINYEAWRKSAQLIKDLIACQFDTVICDESHNMKETTTSAYEGVRSIVYAENKCPSCSSPKISKGECWGENCGWIQQDFGDACSVKNTLMMTGTPILNRPGELFSSLHLCKRETFPDKRSFLSDYCIRNYDGRWEFKYGGLDRLTKSLSDFYLCRDRESAGVKLPPQTITYHDIDFDPVAYPKQYKAMKQLNEYSMLLMENNEVLPILYMITMILRRRQLITWPDGIVVKDPKTKEVVLKMDVQESLKLDWAEIFLKQLVDEGQRIVLFSQFKAPLKELENRLNAAGISCVRYDGDTSPSVADAVRTDFDRQKCGPNPKWQVILANYAKANEGLNFTDCTQMVILDEQWNPGKVEQAYGRIDRIGQTEETSVHVLRINNTVDTWMADLIQEKADLIEGFEQSDNLKNLMYEAIKNGSLM